MSIAMRNCRNTSICAGLLLVGVFFNPSATLIAQTAPETPANATVNQPTLEQLVEQINSEEPTERVPAVKQICARGKDALPVLPRLAQKFADGTRVQFENWQRSVRDHTIAALVEMGPVATDAMIAALGDDDPKVRTGAAEVLGGLRAERGVEPLAKQLTDKIDEAANAASNALKSIGEPAIDALAKVLADGPPSARWRAASALSGIRHHHSVRPLASLLYESDEVLRKWAIQSLSQLLFEHQIWFLGHDPSDDEVEAAETRQREEQACRKLAIDELNLALKSGNLAARIAASECCHSTCSAENIAALVECSSSDDAKLREKALQALASANHADAVAPLVKSLRDSSVEVRMAAASGLSRRVSSVADPKSLIPPLLAALRDTDLRVRVSAANALAGIQGDHKLEGVPALIESLKDGSDDVAAAGIQSLVQIGDRRAADPLHDLLSRPSMRTKAACALASFNDPRCLEPLRALLPSNDVNSVRALGQMKDRESVHAISAMLSDSNEWLRSSAANALGEIGDPRAVEPLVERLQSGNTNDFHQIAEAIAKIKHPYGLVPLINAATRGDHRFRWNRFNAIPTGPEYNPVARPLSNWGPEAIEPLTEALSSPSSSVRDVAAWVFYEKTAYFEERKLEQLESAIEPLAAAVENSVGDARLYAALALGELKDRRAIKGLVDVIAAAGNNSSCPYGRAADLLGEFRDPDTVEPLLKLLKDADPTVRRAATVALCDMREPRGAEPMLPLLKDKHPNVRATAARSLGLLKYRKGAEPLRGMLEDKRAIVRIAAAEALCRFGDADAVDVIVKHLGDPSTDVRMDAIRALVGLRAKQAVEPLKLLLNDEKPEVRSQAKWAIESIEM